MKLYVAYCADRHVDPVVKVFSTPEKAVKFTRQFMYDNMAHSDGIVEEAIDRAAEGLLCRFSYKYESDHAYAFEAELDDESY